MKFKLCKLHELNNKSEIIMILIMMSNTRSYSPVFYLRVVVFLHTFPTLNIRWRFSD